MAAGLAAELRESLGIDAHLIAGGGGIFLVVCDGDVVFDKKDAGRYPILGEVTRILQERRSLA
jgi:predicted Rdx family selenoprotein